MITKIRIRLATVFIWVAAYVGPREMRKIVLNMIEAWAGIPDQRHQGRTGGIIVAPWWVDLKGQNLARAQEKEALSAAYHVRHRIENPFCGPCGEIPLKMD